MIWWRCNNYLCRRMRWAPKADRCSCGGSYEVWHSYRSRQEHEHAAIEYAAKQERIGS